MADEHSLTEEQEAGPDEQSGSDTSSREQPPTYGDLFRYAARILGGALGLLVLLVGLLLLLLQTPWGARQAKEVVIGQLNPLLNDAQIQVDSVSGNFLNRLRLYDASLISTKNDERMAYVDTATARYNLFSLIYRRITIRELTLAKPSVQMEQQPDGSWNLLNAFPADTTAPPEESVFALAIDELGGTDGQLRAVFYNPERGDTLKSRHLNVKMSNLTREDRIIVDVDTAWGAFEPPGAGYEAHIQASGVVGEKMLTVNGLRVTSPRSNLRTSGTLRLPQETDAPLQDIDFRLAADPIAFRDLLPLLPTLNPEGRGTVHASFGGTSQLLTVDGEAQFGNGSSASVNGQLTPLAEGELTYQLQAALRQFNPGYFTAGADPPVQFNADASVDLAGTNLETIDGTLSARLFDSQLGTQQLHEATLESQFSDGRADFKLAGALRGGRFNLQGNGRFFDDVPVYETEGQFAQVELGVLLNNPELSSDLNGRLAAEGVGFDPETANLTADVALTGSTFNGQDIQEGTAHLRLQSGNLNFDATFDAGDGGYIALRGEGSIDRGVFSYQIYEGRFRNFNLAVFTGNPQQQSNLTGTFTAQGRGLNPQTMTLEANLNLAAGSYDTYRLNEGRFSLNLDAGSLAFGGQLALEGGRFELTGSMQPFAQVPTYRADGNFQNVDIGTLTDNPQQSSTLNGRFTLEGTGLNLATARLTSNLTLYDSVLNGQEIQEGTADVSLRSGALTFDASFRAPGGYLAARGEGTVGENVFRYRIQQGRFENVNIALFTGDPSNTSNLTGTFTGQGRGTRLADMTLDLQINLAPSQFNQQDIEEGRLTLALEEGQITIDARIDTPEGRFNIAGTGNLLGPRMRFALQEGSFSGLNLGALLNNPNLRSNLNGTIIFEGRGASLENRTIVATITLRPSTINRAQIRDGRIILDVQRGQGTAEAHLNLDQGSIDVTAQGNLRGTPTYQAQGTARNLDVGALLGNDSLRTLSALDFEFNGTGTDPETMTLAGRVVADTMRFRGDALHQLRTNFRLADGFLRVDTLLARSTFADVTGGGRIALFDPSDARLSNFAFQADVTSLEPLRPFIPAEELALGEGHVEARLRGTPDSLYAEGTAQLTSFDYNDMRVAQFDGRFAGTLDSLRTIETGRLRAEAEYFSHPSLTVEHTNLRATFADTTASFTLDARVDQRRDVAMQGIVNFRAEPQRLRLDSLQLRMDDDRWRLLQPATVTLGEQYRIRNFLLHADDQQIAVDGVIDPDGEQNLVVTVEQFQVGTVTDLLNYEGLSGTVSGSLNLTGPATAPEGEGTLLLDLSSYDEPVGDMRLQLAYAEQQLNVDALLTHRDQSTLSAEGYVPIDLRIAPPDDPEAEGVRVQAGESTANNAVDLSIQADSFAVDWMRPFLDPEQVNVLEGRIHADINVGGTRNAPQLSGQATFTRGRLGLPNLGLTYRDIRVETRLQENQVLVERMTARSEEGRLTGEGTINLSELTLGEFNLDARLDGFRAVDTEQYNATVDGDLTLRGTTRRPILRGNVSVLSADFYVDEATTGAALEDVQLTEEDVRQLEQTFGRRLTARDTSTFDFYEALDMELGVELQRNIWLRSRINPEMNIQLTGQVTARKQPQDELRVFGTIEVVGQQRSYVEIADRRFTITSGVLRFNGPPNNPVLDVEAEYAARAPSFQREPATTITLSLKGTLDNLEPQLGADEDLAGQDILSYLITNQPAGQGLQLDQAGLVGRDLLFGQFTSVLEGQLGQEFGLDVFEIDPLNPYYQAPTLTAGKYISHRFFAGVFQPLTTGTDTRQRDQFLETGTQITLEYELLNWLLARLSGGQTGLRLDLFWEYSY